MILWHNETDAIGYADARLAEAVDQLDRITDPSRAVSRDGMQLCLEAIGEALAVLVLVKHHRQGDALVTIDQLVAETTPAAQPLRRCCQTYAAESHARGCYATARTAMRADVADKLR